MDNDVDTIAAIATPVGEGAVGIVRLSGRMAVPISDRFFRGRRPLHDAESHKLMLGSFVDQENIPIDEVLAVVMRAPHTYTGEDIVEIHCHGGVLLVESILQLFIGAGARPALAGELTQRAFLNGRLDLAQAEAVIDLVKARSPKGLEIAAGQLQGRLSQLISTVREVVVGALTHIQALIDYPEEDLIEPDFESMTDQLKSVHGQIARLRRTATEGKIYKDGLRVGIVGKPNVGKSSLLNALLREDRSIVTPIAGTTRDVIEAQALLGGIPLTLFDTAGIRKTTDPVERIGVERAERTIGDADLILLLFDGSVPMSDEDRLAFERTIHIGAHLPLVVGLNKSDLADRLNEDEVRSLVGDVPIVRISALTGDGLDTLTEKAIQLVTRTKHDGSDAIIVTRARHVEALDGALESLARAMNALHAQLPVELVGVDLQEVLHSLGEVTGESISDEIVGRIFAEFCVGK